MARMGENSIDVGPDSGGQQAPLANRKLRRSYQAASATSMRREK